MGERSGLIKDHRPVNGMYSEADYKELLSLAQRNEGRVVVFSQEISTLRSRVARLEEALKEISTLYWIDAPAPEEMRRIARRALEEK